MPLSIPLYTAPIPAFATLDTLNQLVNALNLQATGITDPNFQAGTGGAFFNPIGQIYAGVTSTGTTAVTTEEVLQTFALPANSLTANTYANKRRGVRVRAWGTTAANANNKTMKLYFGASVITTPTAATNNKNWYLELLVYRNAAGTQVVLGSGQVDTTVVTPYFAAGTDDDTTALTIKCAGTNGTASANDIVCKAMIVDFSS